MPRAQLATSIGVVAGWVEPHAQPVTLHAQPPRESLQFQASSAHIRRRRDACETKPVNARRHAGASVRRTGATVLPRARRRVCV